MPDLMYKPLTESDLNLWDGYVDAHLDGTIFHTSFYQKAIGKNPEAHIIFEGDEIVGGVLLTRFAKFKVNGYHKGPYTPYNGAVFGKIGAKKDQTNLIRTALNLLLNSLPSAGIYEFNLPINHQDFIPYITKGYTVTARITYVLPIELQKIEKYNSSTRNYINRLRELEKTGDLKIISDENIDEFLAFHKLCASERNYDPKTDIIRKLFSSTDLSGKWKCFRIYYKDTLISGCITIWDLKKAYNLLNGTSFKNVSPDFNPLIKQVNALCMHLAIENATNLGLTFDFEGSMLPGVEKFYRHFGAIQTPYYRAVKSPSILYQMLSFGKNWNEYKK